ncbi:hypothetical protein DSAG12_00992 [Promethearchaeum syntrophicum]|uniref:Carboxypeptidase regulatory-like domain-containing protein n=1 Tax=Promethearchaeum syntrophicum TaxID=2594042 RepID=A0A5B9D7J3_9ARCH|nr:hypothetical protein [Candidatus Prometheoarchaeum syntrophicum]QEE15168.1 hypothetical protein DSAG12_00992 [Candidatus Prometheoarchaeum syntrophicum]
MVKLRPISWFIICLFLFSFAFQINYNGQMQTNFQNSLDSYEQGPMSSQDDDDIMVWGEEGEGPQAILDYPLNSLGEIEIVSLYLNEDPTQDNFYPISSNFLNYTHHDPNFEGTIANASAERAIGEEDPRTSDVIIQISESVIWSYNESVTEFIVGFSPVLQTAFLETMYLDGDELNSSEYFVNSTGTGVDETYNFYYDFEDIFENTKDEFNLTYVYNLIFPITEWSVSNTEPTNYISETNQTFTQEFSYHVSFGENNSQINTLAFLKFYLPNYQDIYEPVLENYNNLTLPSDQYSLTDNILTFTNRIYLNETNSLDLTFKANFTVEMLEVVDGLWSEDRLVEGLNIRERDYKITITDGPANLILKNIGINDTGIHFDHLYDGKDSARSALNRYVVIENMNISTGQGLLPNDTDAITEFVEGIFFLHNVESSEYEPYWLLKNEIDIITIKYAPAFDLSIILLDRISTPVEGYSVKLFIGDILYGTSINNFTNMPYPMLSSDENGEIVFHSVPIANYTIEIYDRNGNYLENATVTPLEEVNNVLTGILHYPLVILFFTGIGSAFIVIGYIIFKKNSLVK